MSSLPSLYVLVPRFNWESPVMGVAALCNAIVEYTSVTLVTLKPSREDGPQLDPRIKRIGLAEHGSWLQRRREYITELRAVTPATLPVSLSVGFSGDLFNVTMGRHARTMASLRNNPYRDYRFLYGLRGGVAAHLHMAVLRRMDLVLSMSESMDELLRKQRVGRTVRVPNFIDEGAFPEGRLAPVNGKCLKFLVMGQLIDRKRVDLAIQCVAALVARGTDVQLDILGDGVLRSALQAKVDSLGLQSRIRFHGHTRDRYRFLRDASALLQPSESEGVSRSVMEALFCGVPCVLRKGEASGELIRDSVNGALFCSDDSFIDAVSRVVLLASRFAPNEPIPSLLPLQFRRENAVTKFLAALAK